MRESCLKCNKYDHIAPLLNELHWLPIQQRIEFKILLITFKALNRQAPTYLTDLLISYTPSRSHRSFSKNLLKIPVYNLKSYGGQSFALASVDQTAKQSVFLRIQVRASSQTKGPEQG